MLIDVVRKEVEIANNKKFYGLYNQSLPKRCWSDDSNYAFLSTPQRSNIRSYIINLGIVIESIEVYLFRKSVRTKMILSIFHRNKGNYRSR